MAEIERKISEFQKNLIEYASDQYVKRINRFWDLSAQETQRYCEEITNAHTEEQKRIRTTELHNVLDEIMEEIHRLELERQDIMRLLEENIKT